jgi:hypothetical protein
MAQGCAEVQELHVSDGPSQHDEIERL